MANVRNSNTIYIDSAAADTVAATEGNFAISNIKIKYMVISVTSSTPVFELKDVSTGKIKLRLTLQASTNPLYLDFSRNPIVFPNGISPSTVTNTTATLVVEESRG